MMIHLPHYFLFFFLLLFSSPSSGFGDNKYYFSHWCGRPGSLEYLDDRYCAKKFPSDFNRDWSCPVLYSQLDPSWQLEKPLYQVEVNTSLPLDDIYISIILIRRTASNIYYKYFSNGNHNIPYEPWSSSKIFAATNAASNIEETCNYKDGFYSFTTGKHGKTFLGDLMSIICSYDTTMQYSSNSLARYMHDVGGRERANWLIQNWLNVTNQTFGGNYGEPTPTDLNFVFSTASTVSTGGSGGADGEGGGGEGGGSESCQVGPNRTGFFDNYMSALTLSEFTRRLVLHGDIESDFRVPGLLKEDQRSIMYGAEQSLFFPGMSWGGMTADTSIFIQSGLDMNQVDSRSNGKWRIFSKLGAGYSTLRNVGEITLNSYSCFPILDSLNNTIPNKGVEFVITGRTSVPLDSNLEKAEALMHDRISEVVSQIYKHELL